MKVDEIIEEWLELIKHEYRTITDLELSRGLEHVNNARKLVELTKIKNNEEIECPMCRHIFNRVVSLGREND